MTPFNGDKIRPRLAVRAGDKTFSWLFDTGAAVTCMNKQSFDLALDHSKPKQISKPQSCVAASGDKMSSYGVFKVELFIKGKKFTIPYVTQKCLFCRFHVLCCQIVETLPKVTEGMDMKIQKFYSNSR